MSKTTTFNFKVEGDSYDSLLMMADATLGRFLSSPDEDEFEDENTSHGPSSRVNYEMIVSKNDDISSEYEYRAEVFAKIRD